MDVDYNFETFPLRLKIDLFLNAKVPKISCCIFALTSCRDFAMEFFCFYLHRSTTHLFTLTSAYYQSYLRGRKVANELAISKHFDMGQLYRR